MMTTESTIISINDIRDKYFDGIELNDEESTALTNYDRFRLGRLNEVVSHPVYKEEFIKIRALANMVDFKQFLDIEQIHTISL
ncbi:hypothetical protein [Crocinitomix catalasitica]|uniref:hypothetical protein n=1 Tax=Crocinitomix catalasitica TaxID=184607 RepID=UPI0012FCB0B9|nr:hypothetical protein [Crocinitomix catalasitica]